VQPAGEDRGQTRDVPGSGVVPSTKDAAPARTRRVRRPADDTPSRTVGDNPPPAGEDPGTS